tara:strand:+ start:458 stop:1003 length:546 start_codon:yes stop_codon:yes gene_type:complete
MLTNYNIKFKSVFNRRKRTKKSRPYKQTNMSSKKIKLNHKKKPRTKRNKKKNIIGGTHEEERKLINNVLDIRVDLIRLIDHYNKYIIREYTRYNRETDTHMKDTMRRLIAEKREELRMLIDEKEKDLTNAYSEYATYIQNNTSVNRDTALLLSKNNINSEVLRVENNLLNPYDNGRPYYDE